MSSDPWHGWERTGTFPSDMRKAEPRLHIGPLPNRKSIALYEHTGSTITTLAYFPNEESAQRAIELLDHITGVKEAR